MPVRWKVALGVTPACDEDVMASRSGHRLGPQTLGAQAGGRWPTFMGLTSALPCPGHPHQPQDPLCLGHRVHGLLVAHSKPYGCTLQEWPRPLQAPVGANAPLGASPGVGGRVWVGSQRAALPQAAPKATTANTAVRSATVPAGTLPPPLGAYLCDPGLYGPSATWVEFTLTPGRLGLRWAGP